MDPQKIKYMQEPIEQASPEVRRIIRRVLAAERDKLYDERTRLTSDIVAIIKDEVQHGGTEQ
jgi:hypothetical protein